MNDKFFTKIDYVSDYFTLATVLIYTLSFSLYLVGLVPQVAMIAIMLVTLVVTISMLIIALSVGVVIFAYSLFKNIVRPYADELRTNSDLSASGTRFHYLESERFNFLFSIGRKHKEPLYRRLFMRFACEYLGGVGLLDNLIRLKPLRVDVYASKITGYVYLTYFFFDQPSDNFSYIQKVTYKTTPYNVSSLFNSVNNFDRQRRELAKMLRVEKVNWKKEGF